MYRSHPYKVVEFGNKFAQNEKQLNVLVKDFQNFNVF